MLAICASRLAAVFSSPRASAVSRLASSFASASMNAALPAAGALDCQAFSSPERMVSSTRLSRRSSWSRSAFGRSPSASHRAWMLRRADLAAFRSVTGSSASACSTSARFAGTFSRSSASAASSAAARAS